MGGGGKGRGREDKKEGPFKYLVEGDPACYQCSKKKTIEQNRKFPAKKSQIAFFNKMQVSNVTFKFNVGYFLHFC